MRAEWKVLKNDIAVLRTRLMMVVQPPERIVGDQIYFAGDAGKFGCGSSTGLRRTVSWTSRG